MEIHNETVLAVPMPQRRVDTSADNGPTSDGDAKNGSDNLNSKGGNRGSDQAHNDEEGQSNQEKARIHMMAMHPDIAQWTREQSIRYFFKVSFVFCFSVCLFVRSLVNFVKITISSFALMHEDCKLEADGDYFCCCCLW
jgi:hypothetical protein